MWYPSMKVHEFLTLLNGTQALCTTFYETYVDRVRDNERDSDSGIDSYRDRERDSDIDKDITETFLEKCFAVYYSKINHHMKKQ